MLTTHFTYFSPHLLSTYNYLQKVLPPFKRGFVIDDPLYVWRPKDVHCISAATCDYASHSWLWYTFFARGWLHITSIIYTRYVYRFLFMHFIIHWLIIECFFWFWIQNTNNSQLPSSSYQIANGSWQVIYSSISLPDFFERGFSIFFMVLYEILAKSCKIPQSGPAGSASAQENKKETNPDLPAIWTAYSSMTTAYPVWTPHQNHLEFFHFTEKNVPKQF